MQDTLPFLQNLAYTLLLGLLIGIEREKKMERSKTGGFGGVRTMGLVSVFGYLLYSLFWDEQIIFSLFTAGFILLILVSYYGSSTHDKSYGATTEMAAFFVYLSGVLVGMGETLIATVLILSVFLLLYFREPLHSFALGMEKLEIYDTIKFIVMAFVILPLLPNETFGPLDVLNPYTIWLVVVLVSSISFVSYVVIKLLGPRKGIGLSGFLGGMISSTAVSMSFSHLSQKSKGLIYPFVFGIVIACSAMFFRVLVEVSVLNPDLIPLLSVPGLAMGLTGFGIAFYFWFKQRKKTDHELSNQELHLKSPFQLGSALQFGLLFAALLFISKFSSIYFGDRGVYVTAFLSGLVDVDAITVSMANLSRSGDLSAGVATTAITIATMSNTIVKGSIVLFFGSAEVGKRVFLSMAAIVLVGVLSLLFFNATAYGFA